MEFFQSVQTVLQLKKSAEHIEQMNSSALGLLLTRLWQVGSPNAKQAFENAIWEQILNIPGDREVMLISHYVSHFLVISGRSAYDSK